MAGSARKALPFLALLLVLAVSLRAPGEDGKDASEDPLERARRVVEELVERNPPRVARSENDGATLSPERLARCLGDRIDADERRPKLEELREGLERERDSVERETRELRAWRETLDPRSEREVDRYNAAVKRHQGRAERLQEVRFPRYKAEENKLLALHKAHEEDCVGKSYGEEDLREALGRLGLPASLLEWEQ